MMAWWVVFAFVVGVVVGFGAATVVLAIAAGRMPGQGPLPYDGRPE